MYLPPEVLASYNDEDTKIISNLSNYINNKSCFDEGYTLSIAKSDPTKDGRKVRLMCKGLHEVSTVSRGTKRKKTPNTKGAKKVEHCCKFCIPIYYCSKVKRWYFRKNSGAHFTHNDHGPTPRKLTRVGARNVPKADLDFAIDLLNKNMPKAMVNLVLNIKGGNKMSQGALDYLRRSVLMKQHGTKDGDSTATRLLRMLDDKGATYRFISGSYSEATKLVRIKKHTSKSSSKSSKMQKSAYNTSSQYPQFSGLFDEGEEVNMNEVDQEASDYVESVIKGLEIGDGGEILLGIAWATEDGRESHKAFPHVLGVDVTFNTNNEKRPLFRVIGKNARNKNLPFVDAFIPSMQRYVFSWLFSEALPFILDPLALKKTSMILTDQDVHMIEALNAVLRNNDKKYSTALHRLCKWHKVSGVLFAHICLCK